jgi:hypothetical protein
VKGSITFEFACEDADQAQTYWKGMIEASRPATVVSVSEVVIQLRELDGAGAAAEVTVEEDPPEPESGFPRPKGWTS